MRFLKSEVVHGNALEKAEPLENQGITGIL